MKESNRKKMIIVYHFTCDPIVRRWVRLQFISHDLRIRIIRINRRRGGGGKAGADAEEDPSGVRVVEPPRGASIPGHIPRALATLQHCLILVAAQYRRTAVPPARENGVPDGSGSAALGRKSLDGWMVPAISSAYRSPNEAIERSGGAVAVWEGDWSEPPRAYAEYSEHHQMRISLAGFGWESICQISSS